ncbi:MAG: hypothetical protein U0V74_01370 [Chitinophagales bacterium]
MRLTVFLFLSFLTLILKAQQPTKEQQNFCRNLEKVLEDGRMENFESINGMNEKQSPFLPVPGYNIRLEPFTVIYVDKDHRFVGKTNQSYDSLSALQRLEELKAFTGYCLDTTIWHWVPQYGNDSTTLFFTEEKQWIATSPEFTFSLAMDKTGIKTYNVNLYIKRRRK